MYRYLICIFFWGRCDRSSSRSFPSCTAVCSFLLCRQPACCGVSRWRPQAHQSQRAGGDRFPVQGTGIIGDTGLERREMLLYAKLGGWDGGEERRGRKAERGEERSSSACRALLHSLRTTYEGNLSPLHHSQPLPFAWNGRSDLGFWDGF